MAYIVMAYIVMALCSHGSFRYGVQVKDEYRRRHRKALLPDASPPMPDGILMALRSYGPYSYGPAKLR